MSNKMPPSSHESPLFELEDHGEFIMRHIGPRDEDVETMLEEIGIASLDELISST